MAPVALVASKKGLLSRDSNLKIQENRGEEQKRVRIVGMSGSGGCSGDSLAWCTQQNQDDKKHTDYSLQM